MVLILLLECYQLPYLICDIICEAGHVDSGVDIPSVNSDSLICYLEKYTLSPCEFLFL